jgi:exopolysaccharide biosynthesis protein
VTNGVVTVNPVAERYTEDKQNTLAANRGAVGVTSDNIVMFVTCTSLTPQAFGEAMLDLGSWNAMQVDSGGSSALWYDGEYLAGPGRMINNGLLVIQAK